MKTIAKKSGFITVSIALMAVLSSCEKLVGKGPVVTQTRSINNFSEVSLSLPGRLTIEKGTEFKVELSAQQNILDHIQANKEGELLVLKFKNGLNVKRFEDINVHITMPALQGLTVSGSGNAYTSGSFTGTTLRLWISGSGDLEVANADFNKMECTISGSGDIEVKNGKANESDLRISGSGSIRMENIPTRNVYTSTSGSGGMRVWAEERLDASISGSGTVLYKGAPVVDARISGSGRVTKIN